MGSSPFWLISHANTLDEVYQFLIPILLWCRSQKRQGRSTFWIRPGIWVVECCSWSSCFFWASWPGELDGNFQPPDAPAAERKEREAPKSPQPKATESGSGSRPADVAESRIVRLDVATALVTFLWLGFQGLSSDMNPEHGFWRFLDVMPGCC